MQEAERCLSHRASSATGCGENIILKIITIKNRRVALVDCGLVSDIAGTEYVEQGL